MLLDPALRLLLRLRFKSLIRRIRRSLSTGSGLLMLLFIGCAGFGFILQIAAAIFAPDTVHRPSPYSTAALTRYAPIGFMLLCLAQILAGQVRSVMDYTPAEVNLLFPAPFSWRSLVMYKLVVVLASTTFASIWFSLYLAQLAGNSLYAVCGVFAAVPIITLIPIAILSMIRQPKGTLPWNVGRALVIIASAGLALGLASTINVLTAGSGATGGGGGWLAWLKAAADSSFVRWVTLPLAWPVEAFAATSPIAFILDILRSLIVLALTIDVILLLPPMQMESAADSSERHAASKADRRRRGMLAPATAASVDKYRLRTLPWRGGAGPILARQMVTAWRTSRQLVIWSFALPLCVVLISIGMKVAGSDLTSAFSSGGGGAGGSTVVAFIGIFFLLTFPVSLRFDYRGDLDQLEWLKTLPLPVMGMTLGQLAVPWGFYFGQMLLMAMALLIAVPGWNQWIAAGILLSLPFTLASLTLENILFLHYPVRNIGGGLANAVDATVQLTVSTLRLLALAALAIIMAASGAIGYLVGGPNRIWTAAVAAFLALSVLDWVLIRLLAYTFEHFDIAARRRE